jgi:ATP-dependent DNA helicase PIF1
MLNYLFPQILEQIPGEMMHLYSEDTIADDDPANPMMQQGGNVPRDKVTVTPEQLHMESPSGMPDHELLLKPGAIAMLIRNLDVSSGLVNGLRLRIDKVTRLMVRATALSGGPNIKGRSIELGRIDFEGDMDATVRLKRTQFPLKLAFAMTINKSQGLTLDRVSFGLLAFQFFSLRVHFK